MDLGGNNSQAEDISRKGLGMIILDVLSPPEPNQKAGSRHLAQHEYGEVLVKTDLAERIRQDDLHRDKKNRLEAL